MQMAYPEEYKPLENYSRYIAPEANLLRSELNQEIYNMGKSISEGSYFKGSHEDLAVIKNFKRFKRKGSSSRYKGVFYVKKEKKYRAQICLKGKKKYVGTFADDRDAAIARDKRIRELFGEVEELLNFPRKLSDNSEAEGDCDNEHEQDHDQAASDINEQEANMYVVTHNLLNNHGEDDAGSVSPSIQVRSPKHENTDMTKSMSLRNGFSNSRQGSGSGSGAGASGSSYVKPMMNMNLPSMQQHMQGMSIANTLPGVSLPRVQGMNIQNNIMQNKFAANLARYGSSGSLSFPYIQFSNQFPHLNQDIPDIDSTCLNNNTQNQNLVPGNGYSYSNSPFNSSRGEHNFGNETLERNRNGFDRRMAMSMNQMEYSPPKISHQFAPNSHMNLVEQNQLLQSNYGYNNMFNLGFSDISTIQHKSSMLQKRFSSTDTSGTNFSFGYPNEPSFHNLQNFSLFQGDNNTLNQALYTANTSMSLNNNNQTTSGYNNTLSGNNTTEQHGNDLTVDDFTNEQLGNSVENKQSDIGGGDVDMKQKVEYKNKKQRRSLLNDNNNNNNIPTMIIQQQQEREQHVFESENVSNNNMLSLPILPQQVLLSKNTNSEKTKVENRNSMEI